MDTLIKYISILIVVLFPSVSFALPAFPGAEGMGSSAVGGRGGTVYIVNTLTDNPVDGVTFREACEASGARTVVFAVSGHIRLADTLTVTNPYLTIAGQTSPGGVTVSGGMFEIRTNDVIVTHMRFRMGSDVCDGNGNCDTEGDVIRIMGVSGSNAYNIIFDHCSISWGNDETVDIGGYLGNSYDVTFSRCIIAQGLDDPAPESNHAYGVLIGSHYQSSGQIKVTLHHNYIAHFRDRLPQIVYNGFGDIRNNVIYNWGGALSMQLQDINTYTSTAANFVGNYTKQGALGTGRTCDSTVAGTFYCGDAGSCAADVTDARNQLYVSGNTGCGDDKVWQGYSGSSTPAQGWLSDISANFFAASAFSTTDTAVTTSTMSLTYANTVLADVGANKCQSGACQDTVDAALILNFTDGDGSVLADCHYPSTGCTYPTHSTPAVPTDSDNDGMADSWEIAQFGNITTYNGTENSGDGYTWLEKYLHSLAGYVTSDETAPTISNISPNTAQTCSSNPRNVTRTWNTNEAANCRIHATSSTWAEMAAAGTTGGTSHSDTASQACGASYTPYIVCQDAAENESAASQMSYSIAAEAASQKTVTVGGGSQTVTKGGGSLTIMR